MNQTPNSGRMLVLAGAVLATLLIAAPVHAHEPAPHHHGHKHHQQKHWKHGHRGQHHADVHTHRYGYYRPRYVPVRAVIAPRWIAVHDAAQYRPYLYGSVWHAGHRHSHTVYHFPVSTEHGVSYRPYAYCEGELFVDSQLAYRGSRVSFSIRF